MKTFGLCVLILGLLHVFYNIIVGMTFDTPFPGRYYAIPGHETQTDYIQRQKDRMTVSGILIAAGFVLVVFSKDTKKQNLGA